MKDFLQTLYRNCDNGGYLSVWNKATKLTRYFPLSDINSVESYVGPLAKNSDVYFGVCPRERDLGEEKRGSESDALCLPALFFDFDLGNEHKQQDLPQSYTELEPFINSLPIQPCIIIHSGHGVHAYWVLREPIYDLPHAKEVLWGWNLYIVQKANEYGWKFDNVGELARVLRLPGTLNHKTQPPVEVSYIDTSDAEYDESDFEDFVIHEEDQDEALVRSKGGFKLPENVQEGERNATLFKFACAMRHKGMSEDEIEASLVAINTKRVRPPLPPDEVRSIARSAGKYAVGAQEPAYAVTPHIDEETIDDPNILLSDELLRPILSMYDELKVHQKLSALKRRARKLGVTVRDFDRAVAIVRESVRKQRLAEQDDIPESTIELPVDLDIPHGWIVDECDGVYRVRTVKGITIKDWACAHPVIVTERLLNIDSQVEKLKLMFKRDGEWHEMTVPRSVLASKQAIVGLSDSGIMVNSENSKHLIQFLNEFEFCNIGNMARSKSVTRLGWVGHNVFCPYTNDIVFDGEANYKKMFDGVKSEGSYELWKEEAAKARGRLHARAALAASFASPLMPILGKPIFFVHFWGDSGTGKTVCMMLAASVWGNPRVLTKSFNSTVFALERHAAFMCNLPLFLNEMQTRHDKDNMDRTIYGLSEGTSKGRGTRTGTTEYDVTWQNIIFTNGEEPLTGMLSGAGAKNRVFELYNTSRDPLLENAAHTADVVSDNYGYAGEQYISGLMDVSHADITATYQRARDLFRQEGLDAKYEDKLLTSLAILGMGDYFSSRFVFGLSEADAWGQAVEFMLNLPVHNIESRQEIDQVSRAYDVIRGWLVSNRAHFNRGAQIQEPQYGIIRGQTQFCVIGTILNAELSKMGFSARKVMSGLAERGLISPGNDGKNLTRLVKIDGTPVRCYVFSEFEGEEETYEDEDMMIYEGQIPFEI